MRKILIALLSFTAAPAFANEPVYYVTDAAGGASGIMRIDGKEVTFNRNEVFEDFKPYLTCEIPEQDAGPRIAVICNGGSIPNDQFWLETLPDGRVLFNGLVMVKGRPGLQKDVCPD